MHEERGYKGLVYEIAARLFDFVKAADTRDGLIIRHRSFGAEACEIFTRTENKADSEATVGRKKARARPCIKTATITREGNYLVVPD